MCRFVVIVVAAATLGLDIAAQEGWTAHATTNENILLDQVDDSSIVAASHHLDSHKQQHERHSQRGYPQQRRLLSSWTDEPPPSSPSTSSPRRIKKSVLRLLEEQQQPSASVNDPVCTAAQSMLAKHNLIVDSGDRQTCSYCHNHHVWDDMPFPSNLSTPHDIAAYQEAEWSRSGSSLYEVPLYNFSCSNDCATCFSTNTSNTINDNESTTYCGFIETKEHFVLKPTTTSTLTEKRTNSNTNGNLFYVLDLVAQSFDNAAELCLVYDSSTTNETGKVCYGTMSVDHNDDESTSDNPKSASRERNSRIDRVCYIEYNGMRCNSCREYYTSDATCIAADCSNLESDHALPSYTSSSTSSNSARLDSCSATDQFTGPLRFVQTLGASRRQTTTLTTTATTIITTRGGTCLDQGAPETVAFATTTNPSAAPTPAVANADEANSGDPVVPLREDSGSTASNSSDNDGSLATTRNSEEASSNEETFSTSRCDDTSGFHGRYRRGAGIRTTIAILVATVATTMLPLT